MCAECPWCWREEDEDFPCCHFNGLGAECAPCEREEYDDYYNEE